MIVHSSTALGGTLDLGSIHVVRDTPSHVRMCATGEFDMANARDLAGAVMAQLGAGRTAVVLDMSRVRFIDVVAIEALFAVQTAFRAMGAPLLLVDPSRPVARLLQLSGR